MSFGIWQRTIVTDAGDVIPNATIEVREPSADFSGALVTLYSDEGVTGLSNPFNADSEGFAQFYAAPQKMDIRATGSGSQRTWLDVPIHGTAAVADTTISPTDTTPGRTPVFRDAGILGLGGKNMPTSPANAAGLDDIPESRLFDRYAESDIGAPNSNEPGVVQTLYRLAPNFGAQIAIETNRPDIEAYLRSKNGSGNPWRDWVKLYHTGNTIVDSNGFIKEA